MCERPGVKRIFVERRQGANSEKGLTIFAGNPRVTGRAPQKQGRLRRHDAAAAHRVTEEKSSLRR
ncbi:MAG: hypothetical protein ACHQZS_03890, partial [Candidatus Binatales bacterium]